MIKLEITFLSAKTLSSLYKYELAREIGMIKRVKLRLAMLATSSTHCLCLRVITIGY